MDSSCNNSKKIYDLVKELTSDRSSQTDVTNDSKGDVLTEGKAI